MQNWIGQLVALAVAAVVILIIAAVNLRVQTGAIATVQYQAGKTNQIDLIGLIDRDFRNIGSRYPNYVLDPATAIVSFTDATPGSITFWGQTVANAPPDSITYAWTKTGTVLIDSAYVDAYTITRTVNGEPRGESAGSVTEFDIDLLDSDGNAAGVLSDTRQIRIDLKLTSSLGSSDFVETNDWQTVIRPTALAR